LDRSTREIELGLEYGYPVMNLGSQSFKFEDGQWISGMASCNKQTDLIQCRLKNVMNVFMLIKESGGNVSGKEVQRLKKRNLQLEEENNLLRLKIEVLLDMVSVE